MKYVEMLIKKTFLPKGLVHFYIIFAVVGLTACSKPDRAAGPGGVSMGEARGLDRAAAFLDEQRPSLHTVTESSTAETLRR